MFSVVVPAYNAAETLTETLDAILGQDFADWECIVVDDGSTDDTLGIARAYAERDSRFRAIHQENKGCGGAYNAGVSAAGGEYVVICSADDILLPGHLSRMADFIRSNESYDIFSTNGYYWRENGERELVYSPGELPDSLSLCQVIETCFYSVGAAYRRTLFDRVGGYRTEAFAEDFDFWLRTMASGARHRYLAEPLSLHRVSATQKSANLKKVFRSDIEVVSSLRCTARLSEEESLAVDECISQREHLILRLGDSPIVHSLRALRARLAIGLLGEVRVQRIARRMRAGRRGSR